MMTAKKLALSIALALSTSTWCYQSFAANTLQQTPPPEDELTELDKSIAELDKEIAEIEASLADEKTERPATKNNPPKPSIQSTVTEKATQQAKPN